MESNDPMGLNEGSKNKELLEALRKAGLGFHQDILEADILPQLNGVDPYKITHVRDTKRYFVKNPFGGFDEVPIGAYSEFEYIGYGLGVGEGYDKAKASLYLRHGQEGVVLLYGCLEIGTSPEEHKPYYYLLASARIKNQ